MDSAIGEREMTEDMGGEVAAFVKRVYGKKVRCHGICFKETVATDIRGYPHDGGLKDGNGNKWWVYVHCENPVKKRTCNYDTSFGKVRDD